MKKTKIVATIGPATPDERSLTKLISAGVDVARLNFSHGNLEEKKQKIDLLRSISKKINKQVAIAADLPGPKIRLGEIDGIYQIKKGQELTLGIDDSSSLPIAFDFSGSVKEGERIYLNDGLVELKVISTKKGEILVKAVNSGWVSSRKGINLPDTVLQGSVFTKEDEEFAYFAIKEKVEFIFLSFVQSAKDAESIRKILKDEKSDIKILAKIERPEAMNNIEEIINAFDAVMVARGDLAIETSPAQVPLFQQKIIAIARQQQKPVIVATQMLESMIENPRPTRAEASDVANAVLSQVDAVMLSAESASGKYPVETVETMNSIIETVEADPEFRRYIKISWEKLNLNDINFNAIVASSASLAYRLKAPVISVGTVTGKTAQQLSSFRPSAFICAMTHDEHIAKQLSLYWGIIPLVVSGKSKPEDFDEEMIKELKDNNIVKKGKTAILVWGSKIGISGTTDTIRSVTI